MKLIEKLLGISKPPRKTKYGFNLIDVKESKEFVGELEQLRKIRLYAHSYGRYAKRKFQTMIDPDKGILYVVRVK